MNMKKLMAGVAASALAVSAMAVSASADRGIKSDIFTDDGNGNYQCFFIKDGEAVIDIDVTKIASFDLTFEWEDSDEVWAGGSIITQCDAAGWNELGQWTKGEDATKPFDGVEPGKTVHVELADAFPADSTYVIITVQNYGVDIVANTLVVYDASGAVLYDAAAPATSTPAESTGEGEGAGEGEGEAPSENNTPAPGTGDTTGAGSDPDKTKQPVDTGIEGVAIVAGLAIIAAGAVVVAKKRG